MMDMDEQSRVIFGDDVVLWNRSCEDVPLPRVAVVITDPPYEIGKAWKRGFHGSNGKSPLWGEDQAWDKLHPLVYEFPKRYEVCVIWGGNNYDLPASPHWFVWDKLQKSRGADCELAWVRGVKAHKVFRMSRIDAYVNKANGLKKTHPAQKPLPLMEWCIDNLKLPLGSTIFDPFMGSGTTGVAAINKGMRFIGVERDPQHFQTAVERIQAAWEAKKNRDNAP